MLISSIRRFIARPQDVWFILQLKKRDSSTTTKLTSSYYYHNSSLPFIYKTTSQNFDETAVKYPDHECYVFRGKSTTHFHACCLSNDLGEQKRYTFKSFKQEVDSLAATLLQLGFEKNDRLAVWLPNTSENVAMSFATSKLGLIKVNSDFISPHILHHNHLRLTSILLMLNVNSNTALTKLDVRVLFFHHLSKPLNHYLYFRRLVPELDQYSISRELSSKALPTLKHVILTGEQSSISELHSYNDLVQRGGKLSHEKLNERQASVNPDSPAAIYYTSGTTGQPKAATLTNFGMLNLVHAHWQLFWTIFSIAFVFLYQCFIFSRK